MYIDGRNPSNADSLKNEKKKKRNNFGLRVKHVSPKETGLLLSAWQSVAVTL